MGWSFKGILYQLFIDPLISGLRRSVASHIGSGERVIDVACGTGALTLSMAGKATHVTGIDISEDMINTARNAAERRGITNITLELQDASDLSRYADKEFDVAVASMAMHQFDAGLAVQILSEMNRIAKRIVIADYNCPMRRNLPAALAWSIEYMAAGDHYRNFRNYMQNGGMPWLAGRAGIDIKVPAIRGSGVFAVTVSGF
ncbi:class I SAM-dependent methyltransferase [bacterium]|nr:class I SAM-dependent methyltransferase [bacterium]